jgi:APA family basic amino acid/polyamine antiporter
MIYGLGWTNWARLGGWLAIGFVIYFGYSKNHSILRNQHRVVTPDDPNPKIVE